MVLGDAVRMGVVLGACGQVWRRARVAAVVGRRLSQAGNWMHPLTDTRLDAQMEPNPMARGVRSLIQPAFARCVMPNAPASPSNMPTGSGMRLAGTGPGVGSGRLRFKGVPGPPASCALARKRRRMKINGETASSEVCRDHTHKRIGWWLFEASEVTRRVWFRSSSFDRDRGRVRREFAERRRWIKRKDPGKCRMNEPCRLSNADARQQ
jgi:hypothetical protein